MREYNPDPREEKDGITIEHRFWSACFNQIKQRVNEGFSFYINRKEDGSYWASYDGTDTGLRSILIEEFTPAGAGELVRSIVNGK